MGGRAFPFAQGDRDEEGERPDASEQHQRHEKGRPIAFSCAVSAGAEADRREHRGRLEHRVGERNVLPRDPLLSNRHANQSFGCRDSGTRSPAKDLL
jgi:hypothetical protein